MSETKMNTIVKNQDDVMLDLKHGKLSFNIPWAGTTRIGMAHVFGAEFRSHGSAVNVANWYRFGYADSVEQGFLEYNETKHIEEFEDIPAITEAQIDDAVARTIDYSMSTVMTAEETQFLRGSIRTALESVLKTKKRKSTKTRTEVTTHYKPVTVFKFNYNYYGQPKEVRIIAEDLAHQFFTHMTTSLDIVKKRAKLLVDIRQGEVDCDTVLGEYTPNGEFTPFDHQWQMAAYHVAAPKSANLSQMGTGKTFGALMALDYRMIHGQVRKGLVVCMKAQMTKWVAEAQSFVGRRAEILTGDAITRVMQMIQSDAEIFVTNYEGFSLEKEHTTAKGEKKIIKLSKAIVAAGIDMMILDECHKVKNPAAKRTQGILECSDVPYKIIMSGTINANKLYDVFVPYLWLNNAKHFAVSFECTHDTMIERFKAYYFQRNGAQLVPKRGTIEWLRDRMTETSIRFEKSECLTLPEKVYERRIVELPSIHRQVYQALQARITLELGELIEKGGRVTTMNILAMMTKLSEAANGWVYTNDDGTGERRAVELPTNPKLDAVVETIEDMDETARVVIWSRFTHDLHLITAKLREIYGYDSVICVHGGSTCSECGFSERTLDEKLAAFNDAENPNAARFFVCNPAKGGHGINLTGASYEIFFSNSFVKPDRSQAEDRCHRIGMRDSLTIIDIIAEDTIDETVLNALSSWKTMSSALLEALGIEVEVEKDETDITDPAIQLQYQNKNECMLVSLAMLAGINVKEARAWVKNTLNRDDWFPYQTEDVDRFLVDFNLKFDSLSNMVDIPRKKIGLLRVRYPNAILGHAVVFANNKVYDPSSATPISINKYMAKLAESGGYIHEIKVRVCAPKKTAENSAIASTGN